MSIQTVLTKRLGMAYPIVQAPLAGGGDTPALVAAVCEAGGLGFIGAAYLTPEQIDEASREVRAQTSRPFGINLFAPVAVPDLPEDPQPALELHCAVTSPSWGCRLQLSPRRRATHSRNNWQRLSKAALPSSVSPSGILRKECD